MHHNDIEKKDIPSALDKEIGHFVVNEVSDPCSSTSATLVSRNWYDLFNDNAFWKNKIKSDFKISQEALDQFAFPVSASFYRHIYFRLDYLAKQTRQQLPAIQEYACKNYPALLIACCADNVDHMKQVMPSEQSTIW
jgi:hypothetical protein